MEAIPQVIEVESAIGITLAAILADLLKRHYIKENRRNQIKNLLTDYAAYIMLSRQKAQTEVDRTILASLIANFNQDLPGKLALLHEVLGQL